MMFGYEERGEEFLEGYKNYKSIIEKVNKYDRKILSENFGKLLINLFTQT